VLDADVVVPEAEGLFPAKADDLSDPG
jgi:hypothetical protein